MRKTTYAFVLCAVLLVGGCGTGNVSPNGSVQRDDWQTIKKVDGREIIAELKQTVEETPGRDQAVQEQLESPDYIAGFYGEPSTALEEDMALQAIEGPIAIQAVEEVYGGNEAFEKEGVLFLENQMYGATQSGVWIGVKNPDEKVQEVIDWLQPKVDSGDILAEPIYIFRSPHTQQELNTIQDEVATVLKGMNQERGSFSLAVNTITGSVEIGHDFLKAAQQKELEKRFPGYTFHFEQEGNMIAAPGMSAIIHPEKDVTEMPVTDGGFIMDVSDGSIFVSGGTEGATYYSFDEAHLLTIGQRVKVEASGAILESYPAQGGAKFVEILPDYKPADAVLSESQAVAKAVEEKGQEYFNFNEIHEVRYDKKLAAWIVKVDDGSEIKVEDQ
ncbi:DUF3221 domain-containing protein [Sporosarcina sp. GW1-11]|uniref:DUF3221 domain-containing protein n=1 Tax=Sporosarcina sp. GW1-11 TaxID=2899126 RepID=UPI00294C4F51|nr:DUF3221 domain-containing protein [Sporosarcina sp. GW1-11]MDV6379469.1 DUF3221 domain-containing protein [Sporosarcina sp. GW1-11]